VDKLHFIPFGIVFLFIALEIFFPKRKFSTKLKLNFYLTDGFIVIFNNILFLGFSVSSLYQMSENFFSLKLLSDLDYDNIFVVLGVLILLDFLIYFWHSLNHKVSFLWIFHKAHHTELYLNALSGLRFHIGELILSIIFKSVVLVMFFGIPIEIILLSEIFIVIFSVFHHSNIVFRGEKLFSKIVIVPYLHQVHHSVTRNDHDSNYGVVFSFWDRIFGTFLDKENKHIGLGKIKFQSFWKFIVFGFRNRY